MANSNAWLLNGELREIFNRLQSIDRLGKEEIDGEMMALVTKRLLLAETRIGGPYKELDGSIDPKTNELIDEFMQRRGINLPNLSEFRRTKRLVKDREEQNNNPRFKKIQDGLLKEISLVDSSFGDEIEIAATKILKTKMRFEIGLISYYFSTALEGCHVTSSQIRTLGIANFYTWIAYSIYDDFYDEEGAPGSLSVANYTCRQALKAYASLWPSQRSQKLIESVFLKMDEANAWEVRESRATVENDSILIERVPDYSDLTVLSNRALGHVLGPMLIARNHKSLSKRNQETIDRALSEFLIARQLNDDIHDWHEDLRNGHISPVVAIILMQNNVVAGKYRISTLLPRLDRYFWQEGLQTVCMVTLGHLASCRSLLNACDQIKDNNSFIPLVERLEHAMEKSLVMHKDNKKFLKKYEKLAKS